MIDEPFPHRDENGRRYRIEQVRRRQLVTDNLSLAQPWHLKKVYEDERLMDDLLDCDGLD